MIKQSIPRAENQKYLVGYKFFRRGQNKERTVLNFLTTRNLAGNIVKQEYLCSYDFVGQRMTETLSQTSIDMGKGSKMKLCPHTRTESRYNHASEQWLQVCLGCGAEQTLQNRPWLDFSNLAAFAYKYHHPSLTEKEN